MVSFDAIANASWGTHVLCNTGAIKKNTPYSKPLSFISCGTLAKHIYQKADDVRTGSAAVKEALLAAMKEQAGQDQDKKAELHAKVCKSINTLIDQSNKSLKADKKIPDTFRLDIEQLKAQLNPAPAQEEKAVETTVSTVSSTAPAATTSVMSEQSRTEEPAPAVAAKAVRHASPRRTSDQIMRQEARAFTRNPNL